LRKAWQYCSLGDTQVFREREQPAMAASPFTTVARAS